MTTATANIFEQASRLSLRVDTPVGKVSVEQLWSIPLTARGDKLSLDAIAIALHDQLEKSKNKSFVSGSKNDPVLQLSFDIVKHIIDTIVAENKAKTEAKQRETQVGKIDEIIASKQDAALANMSIEELEKLRAGL